MENLAEIIREVLFPKKKDFKKLKRFIFKIPYFIFSQLETGTKFLAVKFNNYRFFFLPVSYKELEPH